MKITLPSKTLKRICGQVGVAVPARTPLPQLFCVLISADKNGHINFTCDSIALRVNVDHDAGKSAVESPGAALVPFWPLNSFIGRLEGDATIEADEKRALINCGEAHTKLPLLPAAEFPGRKDGLPIVALEMLDAPSLLAGLDFVCKFVGDGKKQPWHENLCVISDKNGIHLLSTTGTQFAIVKLPASPSEYRVNVRGEDAHTLPGLFSHNGWLTLSVQDNQIIVEQDETAAVLRLSEHETPDVLNVRAGWDAELDGKGTRIIVEREKLLEAVRAAGCVLTSADFSCELKAADDKIAVSTDSPHTGGTFSEEIPCTMTAGGGFEVSLSRAEFEKALAGATSDSIVFSYAVGGRVCRVVADDMVWYGGIIVSNVKAVPPEHEK